MGLDCSHLAIIESKWTSEGSSVLDSDRFVCRSLIKCSDRSCIAVHLFEANL